jgi:energy-coupling factor transport system permease protein
LTSEIKIVLYVVFAVSLFVFKSLTIYAVIGVGLLLLFLRVPFRRLKSGWVPISIFLVFTFLSNALNAHGKILFSWGSLVMTDEGLMLASIRTLRVFYMIGGVKVLMASSGTDDVIRAMGRLLGPFERVGLPVKDFFHTMTLTVQCFPRLKDMAVKEYETNVKNADIKGFRQRARVVSSFLLPMFVESIRSPEMFFEKKEGGNG